MFQLKIILVVAMTYFYFYYGDILFAENSSESNQTHSSDHIPEKTISLIIAGLIASALKVYLPTISVIVFSAFVFALMMPQTTEHSSSNEDQNRRSVNITQPDDPIEEKTLSSAETE
ncbi:UNVERIFIED_CONTAM: hypothetical protein RMT77_006560 [Armadillidium vulgare]